ncbi:hypothetical protein vBSlqSZDD2_56 [Serratia phage vB_SlqS_ZDD2]|nr:hypothetical protein vBSlqSZDD2_56 [Serratia phage vB_SlqS_ZDD2]
MKIQPISGFKPISRSKGQREAGEVYFPHMPEMVGKTFIECLQTMAESLTAHQRRDGKQFYALVPHGLAAASIQRKIVTAAGRCARVHVRSRSYAVRVKTTQSECGQAVLFILKLS